jgi:Spy/CpxP family protein refolding chaperone
VVSIDAGPAAAAKAHVHGTASAQGRHGLLCYYRRLTSMAKHWKLDEQDQRLRELVERARSEGPQQIDDEDQGVAVVVSLSELERLRRGETQREGSLVEFFRRSPLAGVDLDR